MGILIKWVSGSVFAAGNGDHMRSGKGDRCAKRTSDVSAGSVEGLARIGAGVGQESTTVEILVRAGHHGLLPRGIHGVSADVRRPAAGMLVAGQLRCDKCTSAHLFQPAPRRGIA